MTEQTTISDSPVPQMPYEDVWEDENGNIVFTPKGLELFKERMISRGRSYALIDSGKAKNELSIVCERLTALEAAVTRLRLDQRQTCLPVEDSPEEPKNLSIYLGRRKIISRIRNEIGMSVSDGEFTAALVNLGYLRYNKDRKKGDPNRYALTERVNPNNIVIDNNVLESAGTAYRIKFTEEFVSAELIPYFKKMHDFYQTEGLRA